MREDLTSYCIRTGNMTPLKQWEKAENGDLTPEQVTPGSNRKVWWRCAQGHVWKASIKSVTRGTGCPICINRTVLAGENDLAALAPEIAAQWHPTKNGELEPRHVLCGSHIKVWWQCERGHEWQARIASRAVDGRGCPYCAGKKVMQGENDLAAVYPELAREWHPTENGDLAPWQVTTSSNRKVWWRCEKGHSYQAIIAHRCRSDTGCPYCAGRKVLSGFNDLASKAPKVAEQWHPTLNEPLTPEMVSVGSRRKVWWECGNGHVWKTVVYSRTGSHPTGCPVCAGKADAKCKERSDRALETVP